MISMCFVNFNVFSPKILNESEWIPKENDPTIYLTYAPYLIISIMHALGETSILLEGWIWKFPRLLWTIIGHGL
jgi:hypothetical protein